jgi:hypothetical protein
MKHNAHIFCISLLPITQLKYASFCHIVANKYFKMAKGNNYTSKNFPEADLTNILCPYYTNMLDSVNCQMYT